MVDEWIIMKREKKQMYCLIVTYVLIATCQYLYAIKVVKYGGGGHVGHVEFINNGKYCNKNMKY